MAHQTHTTPHPEDMHAHEGGGSHVGHVVPPRILIATALALLALTVITVYAAKIDFAQFDLPELNIFVAMAIAVVKASLVCLFFMHLRWDRPFNAFVLVVSLALVGLFISFVMTDSAEYQREIIRAEGQDIQNRMTTVQEELAKEAATPTPPAEHH